MEWYTAGTSSDEDGGKLIVAFESKDERERFMDAVKATIAAGAREDFESKKQLGMLPVVPEEENNFFENDTTESELFEDRKEDFAVKLRYYIAMLNEKARQVNDAVYSEQRENTAKEIKEYAGAIHEEFRILAQAYDEFRKSCRALFEMQRGTQKRTSRKLSETEDMLAQYEAIITSHASCKYLPKEYTETDRTVAAYYNLAWREKINQLKAVREERRRWLNAEVSVAEPEIVPFERTVLLRKISSAKETPADEAWFHGNCAESNNEGKKDRWFD